jgi:predicted phosphodiesterase
MNLLILSDLHIGNNDHFETFGWRSAEFIKALERIKYEEKIDKIILNGDVFELYKYSFQEIRQSNPKLVEYLLHNPGIVYIKGNHDAICAYGQESVSFENSEGKQIYIEHGHSADFMNGTSLGRKIQTFGFNLLRWGSKFSWILKIYQKILEMEEAVNRIPKRYDSIKYLSHALRLLKNHDVVVLGHTHKIESHKTYYLNNKKVYINCGSCSLGRFQAVLLNTESLKHETIKFKNYKELKKHYNSQVVREMLLIA